MHEVRVTHDFNFAIEKVFSGVSDHVAFLSTSEITCRMKRDGDIHPYGLGALREVRNGKLCLVEEITAFDSPNAYEYRILSLRGPLNLKLPFRHQMGRLELHDLNGKTRLVWSSRFNFSAPLIGHWIERKLGRSISTTFLFFLKRLEARLVDALSRA